MVKKKEHQVSDRKIFPKEIEYEFEKLDGYRVIFVDGVWGGVTNQGLIRMELFAESQMIQSVKYEVVDGKLGDEIERIPKQDTDKVILTREVQLGTVMTLNTAKFVAKWLKEKCDELEALNQ